MRDTGSTTSSTDRAWRSGPTARSMKALTNLEKKTATANSSGPTCLRMRAISSITTFTGLESTAGPTVVFSKATGYATKCMAAATSAGPTDGPILVTTTTTKRTDMVFLRGPTVGSTMVRGAMASRKASASTKIQTTWLNSACGKMEKGSNGLRSRNMKTTSSNNRIDTEPNLLYLTKFTNHASF